MNAPAALKTAVPWVRGVDEAQDGQFIQALAQLALHLTSFAQPDMLVWGFSEAISHRTTEHYQCATLTKRAPSAPKYGGLAASESKKLDAVIRATIVLTAAMTVQPKRGAWAVEQCAERHVRSAVWAHARRLQTEPSVLMHPKMVDSSRGSYAACVDFRCGIVMNESFWQMGCVVSI